MLCFLKTLFQMLMKSVTNVIYSVMVCSQVWKENCKFHLMRLIDPTNGFHGSSFLLQYLIVIITVLFLISFKSNILFSVCISDAIYSSLIHCSEAALSWPDLFFNYMFLGHFWSLLNVGIWNRNRTWIRLLLHSDPKDITLEIGCKLIQHFLRLFLTTAPLHLRLWHFFCLKLWKEWFAISVAKKLSELYHLLLLK